ncbi:hypothetical protein PMAYCL1PPCAC_10090, partial [Pristionchus mayeri]
KEVYGFGPGAQPTEHCLIQILENRTNDRFLMDTLEKIASEWLNEVSKDLDEASLQDNITEEYLQDFIEERSKLITRLKIIANLREEQATIEVCFPKKNCRLSFNYLSALSYFRARLRPSAIPLS